MNKFRERCVACWLQFFSRRRYKLWKSLIWHQLPIEPTQCIHCHEKIPNPRIFRGKLLHVKQINGPNLIQPITHNPKSRETFSGKFELFVSFLWVQVAINMLGWACTTSEHFFATAKSRWVIRVCVGIMNLSICNCKGIIIFNQNTSFRTLCTEKNNVVVVGFDFETGTIEVNLAPHVAPQRRASFWSFTQPFLTASAEPFLRRHLSKIKFRLWAICWEDQCQVWYVFWAILRAPTKSEFWISSVWRKFLPTEIVEGQVYRPNWEIG